MQARRYYSSIYQHYDEPTLQTFSEIKRFIELSLGDKDFRTHLQAASNAPNALKKLLESHLLFFNPDELLKISDTPPHISLDETKPLAKAWSAYLQKLLAFRDQIRQTGHTKETSPRFDQWRNRQMARCEIEMSSSQNNTLVHAVVAYELCNGCRAGCWFCGVSADDFQSYWPHTPDNATLWRDVLTVMKTTFGEATKTGFAYWATDPLDNPDYTDFMKDHYDINGFTPQITTAVAARDLDFTKRVINAYREHELAPNRFSILTLKALRAIHTAFSPRELLQIELVLQHKNTKLFKKACSGKAREAINKLKGRNQTDKARVLTDQMMDDGSTIACVTGFLINLPLRRIRLISPTTPSDQCPNGYITFDEASFQTACDFQENIQTMINDHMSKTPSYDNVAALNPNLSLKTQKTETIIESPYKRFKAPSGSTFEKMLALIHPHNITYDQMMDQLIEQGISVFEIMGILQTLYDKGILAENSSRITSAPKEQVIAFQPTHT
jgi:radical SAM family RiPP maturation amino acid epimerase